MNASLRLLLSLSLAVSCSAIHAMDSDEEDRAAYRAQVESKFVAPPEQGDLEGSSGKKEKSAEPATPENKQSTRMAKIQELAKTLEASINSNVEYYELSAKRYKNNKDLKELTAQMDLITPTHHIIQAIMKLTAVKDIDIDILENVINGIPPFKIKYVALTADKLPALAKTKVLKAEGGGVTRGTHDGYVVGYAVKDNTINYQQAMLCALLDCNSPLNRLTDTHLP